MSNWIDIFDIVPDELEFDFENYHKMERDVLTPAIKEAGYQIQGPWYNNEADSFGPLSRAVRALDEDNNIVILWYG